MYRCSCNFKEKHTYKHSLTRITVAHVFDGVSVAQSVSSGSQYVGLNLFFFETNDEAARVASVAAIGAHST